VENAFASIRHQRALGTPESDLLTSARALYADTLPKTRASVIQRNAYGTSGDNSAPRSLAEAIAAFVADRSSRWEAKTLLMHRASLDLFAKLIGSK
jgi:hypothetical protein